MCFVPVIHCPKDFAILNAHADNPEVTSYGSIRTYTCEEGYVYPDIINSTEMDVVCTANKTWDADWEECIRKIFLYSCSAAPTLIAKIIVSCKCNGTSHSVRSSLFWHQKCYYDCHEAVLGTEVLL